MNETKTTLDIFRIKKKRDAKRNLEGEDDRTLPVRERNFRERERDEKVSRLKKNNFKNSNSRI